MFLCNHAGRDFRHLENLLVRRLRGLDHRHAHELAWHGTPSLKRHGVRDFEIAGFGIQQTDLDVPGGVNGNRLAEAAAAIPALKIITMTGYNEGRPKNRSERQVSGTRAHLQKPFTRAELEDALRRVMPV